MLCEDGYDPGLRICNDVVAGHDPEILGTCTVTTREHLVLCPKHVRAVTGSWHGIDIIENPDVFPMNPIPAP
jgi:hypothetical protein